MSKKSRTKQEPPLEAFIEPPLKAPPPLKDGYIEPRWEFPAVLDEPFDLEPEFVATQKEFALSKLLNNM